MKIETKLIMRGEQANLERLLPTIETRLRDGWRRDREAEERARQHGMGGPWDCCIDCSARADRPAAGFWIHPRGYNQLSISHVSFRGQRPLAEDADYRLLEEFKREFVDPAAAEVGVEAEIVQHQLTVERNLSVDARWLLREFSKSANRTSLTRDDRRRWNAFLVQLHRDEWVLDLPELDEWLQEEGWPEQLRNELIEGIDPAMTLLEAYDEEVAKR